LEIVEVLCEHAGGFMRMRVADLWPGLMEMYQQASMDLVGATTSSIATPAKSRPPNGVRFPTAPKLEQTVARMHSSLADYSDTAVRLIWDALVNCLTTIVQYVPLSPEAFDETLEMLRPLLREAEVQTALESKNTDAVWLAKVQAGSVQVPDMPSVPEGVAWRFVEVPS